MKENEVPRLGDFVKWSENPRDIWVEVGHRMAGLPVATLRARHGQSQLQFATFSK